MIWQSRRVEMSKSAPQSADRSADAAGGAAVFLTRWPDGGQRYILFTLSMSQADMPCRWPMDFLPPPSRKILLTVGIVRNTIDFDDFFSEFCNVFRSRKMCCAVNVCFKLIVIFCRKKGITKIFWLTFLNFVCFTIFSHAYFDLIPICVSVIFWCSIT